MRKEKARKEGRQAGRKKERQAGRNRKKDGSQAGRQPGRTKDRQEGTEGGTTGRQAGRQEGRKEIRKEGRNLIDTVVLYKKKTISSQAFGRKEGKEGRGGKKEGRRIKVAQGGKRKKGR